MLGLSQEIKKEFPFFKAHPDLVYLDTAATAQKPKILLDSMHEFFTLHNAPVHRAAYDQSIMATERYEKARQTIAEFIGADDETIIFTKGATEGLNLLAHGLKSRLSQGDEILVLETEHHANLLPWQRLSSETKAVLVKLPVTESGHVDCEALKQLVSSRTKIVALAHMSNVTGAIQDLKAIIAHVKQFDCFTIIDGAQGICHSPVNVKDLGCDAYVFSSHKLYGPTGLGVVYVSSRLEKSLDLYQVGGDVIESVSFESTIYKTGHSRFEAGTPMVAEVYGFSKVLEYLKSLDMSSLAQHERSLVSVLKKELKSMPGVHLIGDADTGLVSFYSDYVHALDLATYLNTRKIAIRSGHLCAQPALKRFHTTHAARISCGLYTTQEDIEKALSVIQEALVFFS